MARIFQKGWRDFVPSFFKAPVEKTAVWCLDIGDASFKALHCIGHNGDLLADAFDFIRYPQISPSIANDRESVTREAIKAFLSRNVIAPSDTVAVSVSAKFGLAKYLKLPPMETDKIPEVVRMQAKVQLPFFYNWDFYQVPGTKVVDDYSLDAEFWIFGVDRYAVRQELRPLKKQGIKADLVQLSPLALQNYLVFDRISLDTNNFNLLKPLPYIAAVMPGNETTCLLITNGLQLSPHVLSIGGNHFTRAVQDYCNLSLEAAEIVKCNPTGSKKCEEQVPKAIRSQSIEWSKRIKKYIDYFSARGPSMKVEHVVALGNTIKLPDLAYHLCQELGLQIVPMPSYNRLVDTQVTSDPIFRDNSSSFSICFGLATQALGKGQVNTNFLSN